MIKKHPFLFKLFIVLSVLIALIAIIGSILLVRYSPSDARQNYDRFSAETYDSVFLSMYPIDNYNVDDFNYWRSKNAIFIDYEIPDHFILKQFLSEISQNSGVNTIYLGLRPEKISGERLSKLLSNYPQYQFFIFLAHPTLEYWASLPTDTCNNILDAYKNCITELSDQSNIAVYFWGSAEWLIANPANYENSYLTNAGISSHLLHFEEFPEHFLDASNGPAVIDNLAALITRHREAPLNLINLTDEKIVFFGDSIIGNFTKTNSISNVTSGLTGATSYNLGLGGTPAAQPGEDKLGLVPIVNAFLAKDLSLLPADSQSYLGLEKYITDLESSDSAEAAPYCFIINYGLNDYFLGLPISSDDPYDPLTYTGAFRTAVQAIRQSYANTRILVTTPNFTVYFNNGTETHSEHNHTLADYAEALIALAEELDIELLDNFHELDINADNHTELLSDGCHPNEEGRFIMGVRIAEQLTNGAAE